MRRTLTLMTALAVLLTLLPLGAGATPLTGSEQSAVDTCMETAIKTRDTEARSDAETDTELRDSLRTVPPAAVNQRNGAWLADFAAEAADYWDAEGDYLPMPGHEASNIDNHGTHSLIMGYQVAPSAFFAEDGEIDWQAVCDYFAVYAIDVVLYAAVDRIHEQEPGTPIYLSYGLARTEEAVSNDSWLPEYDSPGILAAFQIWAGEKEEAGGGFVDVEDDNVFAADIAALAASGITKGCNPPQNDRFCPDDHVTRGQMAAFLNRALGLGSGNAKFTDTAGNVFAGDIAALADAGITRGCNPPQNDRFCPDDRVTRGQMAAFLVRALGLGSGNAMFTDTAGNVFAGDIAALADAGITRGCNPPTNDRFCPDDYVTRGQMAAFLVRAGLTG